MRISKQTGHLTGSFKESSCFGVHLQEAGFLVVVQIVTEQK